MKRQLSPNIPLFFFILAIAGGLFSLIWMCLTGNKSQIYNDYVIELQLAEKLLYYTSKNFEVMGMYILVFGGLLALFTFCYVWFKQKSHTQILPIIREVPTDDLNEIISIIFILSMGTYFLFNDLIVVLVGLFPCIIVYLLKSKDNTTESVFLYFLLYYAEIGIYRFFVFCGKNFNCNNVLLVLLASIVTLIVAFQKSNIKFFMTKVALICQLFIPCVLFVFLSNRYYYNNHIELIKNPIAVRLFIFLLVGISVIEIVDKIRKSWITEIDCNKIIGLGTCICINLYNGFGGSNAIMSRDLHHPFENIIGYHQIFVLNQKAFAEYMPISGMYSVVHGWLFDFFGNGFFANYFITTNVFFGIIAIFSIILIDKQIPRKYVFLICLIFMISDVSSDYFYGIGYDRHKFILPSLLLLALPQLLQKKNLWLQIWLVVSLFNGLYYPLYGVAVFMAFLPLGIYQCFEFFSSGELKLKMNQVSFWFSWLLCLFLFITALPWLVGLYLHILNMANQSVMNDSLSRFGQMVPEWFALFLQDDNARLAFYDVLSYLVPAIIVWVGLSFSIYAFKIFHSNNKFMMKDKMNGLLSLSLVIMPLIAYSFTFLRLDPYVILARSGGVLIADVIVLFVLSKRILIPNAMKNLTLVCVFIIPVLVYGIGFNKAAGIKLEALYKVPSGFILINNDEAFKLGNGFMDKSDYDYFKAFWKKYHGRQEPVYAVGDFGYIYLTDLKACSTGSADTITGYKASCETVTLLKNNKALIGGIANNWHNGIRVGAWPFGQLDAQRNYYLTKWLLTSGYYVWNNEQNVFTCVEEDRAKHDVQIVNRQINFPEGRNMGNSLFYMGESIYSLYNIFTKVEVPYTMKENKNSSNTEILFESQVNGNDMDFIYIELAMDVPKPKYVLYDYFYNKIEKKPNGIGKYLMQENYDFGKSIIVSWEDDDNNVHYFQGNIGKGKLLLPLGVGNKWLLHNHKKIVMAMKNNDTMTNIPKIQKIEFFKLRDVE